MAESPTPGSIKTGDIIAGRYEVRGIVGRGGMGRIYRVFDRVLGEEVALKTLLPDHIDDKIILDRFFNEAKIARSLSHPSIVRVHDIGRAGHVVYISMELLKGKSLRQMLDQLQPGQRLPIAGILRMFDALCAALDYAHRFTVHRDIKPENVMILENGSVKLMDFGISKLMSNPNLTSASIVMGTPHYMPPEQLKNTSTVDARADIYSVGVMLYEVLTGDRPTGLAKPASKIHGEVPAALDPIIEKCCQPDPAKRYKNAEELRAALRAVRVAVERKTGAGGPSTSEAMKAAPVRSATPLWRVALGAVFFVAIVVGALMGLNWAEARRRALVEAAPPRIGSPTARTANTAAPAAVFRQLAKEIPALQTGAEKAAADYSAEQRESLIDPVLALGADLWAAAQAAKSSEPDRALDLGWDAAACYLAPAIWPDGMTFIPPSPPDAVGRVQGFFIDARPVSAADFTAFRESTHWRAPEGGSNDAPITGVTFYDALAFVASAQPVKHLPTVEQFEGALAAQTEHTRVWPLGSEPGAPEKSAGDTAPDAAASDEPLPARNAMPWLFFPQEGYDAWGEWTASSPDNVDPASAAFGDTFFSWGGGWSGDQFAADDPVPVAFEQADAVLGFRGVVELPRTLAQLAAVR